MLGAFTQKSSLVSFSSVVEAMKTALKNKRKLISINNKALTLGHELL